VTDKLIRLIYYNSDLFSVKDCYLVHPTSKGGALRGFAFFGHSESQLAGWPWVVTSPGLPQIRTCPIKASGSSGYGFAAYVSTRGERLASVHYLMSWLNHTARMFAVYAWQLGCPSPPKTRLAACWLGFGRAEFASAGFHPQVSRRHRFLLSPFARLRLIVVPNLRTIV